MNNETYFLADLDDGSTLTMTAKQAEDTIDRAFKMAEIMEPMDDDQIVAFIVHMVRDMPCAIGVFPEGPARDDGALSFHFHIVKGKRRMTADAISPESKGPPCIAIPCPSRADAEALERALGDGREVVQ